MSNRFKLLLFLAIIGLATVSLAQSAPEPAPTPEAAPAVAAAPAAPSAPATGAKTAAPTAPVAPARPEAPKAPAPSEPRSFLLNFALKELDGNKVVNSREYKMLLQIQVPADEMRQPQHASIRNGSRVPVTIGGASGQQAFVEIGVFLDIDHAVDLGHRLSMDIRGDISSPLEVLDGKATGNPVIRQTKFSSRVLLTFGKPTLVYSSDDVSSTRKIQVEVTATPAVGEKAAL